MKAAFVDFHRKRKQILEALDRNETVTLTHRGKEKADIVPRPMAKPSEPMRIEDHPFFGMWKDRTDMKDVEGWLRRIRRGRRHAR